MLGVSAAIAVGGIGPAVGQEAGAGLTEIVVTAQRREEALQRTPVSVTALTAEALEDRQVTNVLDIAAQVPNLRIEPVTGTSNSARVFLRGVGEDQSTPTTDSAIGLYVDGVYYARTLGALFDFLDVERIEVLRGPQGTLYGRNTSAGAIRVISRRPTDELRLQGDLTVGDYDRRQLRALASGPIGGGVNASLALLRNKRDGIADNVTLGTDVNDRDVTAIRGAFALDPTDAVDLTLRYDWMDDESDPSVPTSILNGVPDDLHRTEAGELPFSDFEAGGLSLDAGYRFGRYELRSITAYRELELEAILDNDGRADRVLALDYTSRQDQFSQELTLAADWERVVGLIGVYYFTETNDYDSVTFFGQNETVGFTDQETDSYAVFGQATWSLTDALSLTVGARYTRDEKDFSDFYPELNGGTRYALDDDWSAFTPKVAVDYQVSDNVFLFASYAEGYKTGGMNRSTTAVTALTPYDEESVTTYEAGVKSEFLDRRLRLNLTYFYNDYEDLQLSTFDPATNVSRRFNAAQATTKGVEMELSVVPFTGLQAYLTGGYLDAGYDEFVDRVNGELVDVSDRELKGAPRWQYAAGFTYDRLLPVGSMRLNGEINERTRVYNNVANTPSIVTPRIRLLNASLGWRSTDERWTVTLAGKNLTDKEYFANALFIGGLTSIVYPAEPRTWTLSVGYSIGR